MFAFVRRPGFALVASCLLATGVSTAQTPAPQAPASKPPVTQPPATQPPTAQSPAAQPPTPAAAVALPDAQTLIDRHIQAIGGRAALKARQSAHLVGNLTVPANGMSGTVEVFAARPNKVLVKQNIAGVGEVAEGFDGTHAWSINPMTGPMLASAEERAQREQDADFDSQLNIAARYASMKTVEKTTFDARECYKVSLTRKDGTEDIEYYDAATGLKAGMVNTRKSPMGAITVTTTLKDYKKVGDILQPSVMRQAVQGVEMVTTFTTIEYDKVDPAVFELPAPIKALIK